MGRFNKYSAGVEAERSAEKKYLPGAESILWIDPILRGGYILEEQLMIEQEIYGKIKAARIRLRFDRVALRLVGGLQAALAAIVPGGEAVLFTLSAPIRHPAKTATDVEGLVRGLSAPGERRERVHGNDLRIRRLIGLPPHTPKVMGFVHHPGSDAGVILSIAEARLRKGS